MDRTGLHLIQLIISDREKLPARLLTGITVLLLILAGTPFFNTDTSGVDAAESPYASPSISNLTNSVPTSSGSFIFWDTNISSNNRVYYGLNEADVNNLTNGSWSIWDNDTFNVIVRLSGLSANTTYYYKPESWYLDAVNDSISSGLLLTLKPGVWTSPSEYMVSPPEWTGSPVNFRTVNISAAILNNVSGRYVHGLSLEAVIYNNTGAEIGRTNLSGSGPYSGSFILPDYLDEGGYVVRITDHPNIAGEFSVLRWGCANCHMGEGDNYPSTFNATTVHPEHFETTDINTVHCGDDLCNTQTTYTSTQQCQQCHPFKAPSWAGHPYPRQPVECSGCHKSPSGGNAALVCENCHGDRTTTESVLAPRYGQDRHYQNETCNDCHNNLTSLITKPSCTTCHPRPGSILNGTAIPDSIQNTSHSLGKTVPCGLCHNREHDVKSLYTLDTTVCRTCHTGITHNMGAQCTACHGSDPHNITIVAGPNCIDCHDIGKVASHQINSSAMNSSNAIHANLNRNATNSTGIPAENKKCWGCHDSNGSQPSGVSMGDRFTNPYKCYDCHNAIGKPYNNVSSAPNVSQHFLNGTSIKAALNASDNSSSCIVCHNLTEMKVDYTGDNYGTDFSFPSHYGKSRALDPQVRQGNATDCAYCHQNTSTAFVVAMMDLNNSNISNHSMRYNSSNPPCVQCHNSGWIHNSTLTKPALTLPNSTFCLSCHGNNGSGGTNYSGMVTGIREKHNNTINCTECHFNSSRDIHPVKYLQPDESYSTGNSTGVNCTNCHQGTAFYPGLSKIPPKIPSPLHHSDNPSNGTRWNSTGYWDNTSEITACIYCHNDTRHKAAALGRPESWRGDNKVNSSITNTSNWCAGCHYQGYTSGGKNYGNMTSAFISANLPVPPEITNGIYAPNTMPGFYYHNLTPDYNDSTCKTCHSIGLNNGTMDAFLHNITARDCKGCHFSYNVMNSSGSPTAPARYVNSIMFNEGAHGNVSCRSCHTAGHNSIGARKACEDCHAVRDPDNPRERHNITGDPYSYKVGGVSVVDITDCTICHDRNLYNKAVSTYGINKPVDCDYCHTYPDKNYSSW
ncbi:fibronectin type III domain-containing protein [Candidatus Methanoperedens nitratireducens]|uniref:Class III cytochrome C domain-containing protein n=1 Tax=Candidatus Methanoperedens nitratireducens TaxID=1392998 RepID=A0A284VQS6_9EURY|nr:fibronectin type III domain-containing protein [Candidatus Methanoperedens nitroreducens]SNQ61559.1 hypothetical protein MNV_40027 [Candidatus Methanoperedens nitroreducens]